MSMINVELLLPTVQNNAGNCSSNGILDVI